MIVALRVKDFSISSSGGQIVQRSETFLGNFGRGLYEEHLCEMILHLDLQIRRCLVV